MPEDEKEPEALVITLRIFTAIVSGLALLAVATPIALMAAAIVLQPAWKDWRAEDKSLLISHHHFLAIPRRQNSRQQRIIGRLTPA